MLCSALSYLLGLVFLFFHAQTYDFLSVGFLCSNRSNRLVKMSANKRVDLSVCEKIEIFKKYDSLPKMSQTMAAQKLGISQSCLSKLLKNRQTLEAAPVRNESCSRKRKRAGKDEDVESALFQWFTQVRQQDARVNGPLMRQKAEELAKKMGKTDFVATDGWFSR